MILVELNPFSPFVAVSEIVIVLLLAALTGYLIGRWITKGRLKRLREVLETKEGELNDCKALQQVPAEYNAGTGVRTESPAEEKDDLKLIEGIGPRIEKLLNAAGISSFSELAESPVEELQEILLQAGPRFRIHDPASWPEQSALARDGKWEELEALQEKLTGGRDVV